MPRKSVEERIKAAQKEGNEIRFKVTSLAHFDELVFLHLQKYGVHITVEDGFKSGIFRESLKASHSAPIGHVPNAHNPKWYTGYAGYFVCVWDEDATAFLSKRAEKKRDHMYGFQAMLEAHGIDCANFGTGCPGTANEHPVRQHFTLWLQDFPILYEQYRNELFAKALMT